MKSQSDTTTFKKMPYYYYCCYKQQHYYVDSSEGNHLFSIKVHFQTYYSAAPLR